MHVDRLRSELFDDGDVRSLEPFWALLDLVLDLGALVEAAVALTCDRAEVDEDVVSAFGGADKAVALVGVEPLHCSGCHSGPPLCVSCAASAQAFVRPAGAAASARIVAWRRSGTSLFSR